MKTNQIAGRCVLACVFVYLLIQIYYLSNYIVPSATKEPWRDFVCLFLIQSVFFAVCIFAVFIFLFLQRMKRENTSPFEALLLVNSEGKIKREVLLSDKHSFLITGAKTAGMCLSKAYKIRILTDIYTVYAIWSMAAGILKR